MTVKYLEDFAAGQTFGSGWLVVETEQIKEVCRCVRSAALSSRRERCAGYRLSWLGSERLAYGGCDHAAPGGKRSSSWPAASSAQGSMNSAGRVRFVQETNYGSRVKLARAIVRFTPEPGLDQSPDDDAEPER